MAAVKAEGRSPQDLAGRVRRALRKTFPQATCELNFKTPLELLAATVLSAQCTDKRVNLVTEKLFKKYRKAGDYARANPSTLESEIRSTGFFRMKAKSLLGAGKMLIERFGGKVPKTMEELIQLPGVARKTANVVLGTAFGVAAGIVVDTHVKRLAYRMGLSDERDPEKIERNLMKLIPEKDWIWFGHAMTWHGRRVCSARAPNCPGCVLNTVCPKRGI